MLEHRLHEGHVVKIRCEVASVDISDNETSIYNDQPLPSILLSLWNISSPYLQIMSLLLPPCLLLFPMPLPPAFSLLTVDLVLGPILPWPWFASGLGAVWVWVWSGSGSVAGGFPLQQTHHSILLDAETGEDSGTLVAITFVVWIPTPFRKPNMKKIDPQRSQKALKIAMQNRPEVQRNKGLGKGKNLP